VQSWETIDHENVPDDHGGVLYLMRRGDEYAIHVNGYELMGNTLHGSEAALADVACDHLARLDDARILVGGLGMGFTLASALQRVGLDGRVTVSELMPAVVRWNRGPMAQASGYPLRDPRAEVYLGDVGDLVEHPDQPWSAILLDVDNGPRALTRPTNAWLYTEEGLAAAWEALIPGGVLGIWSADDDDTLTRRLQTAGFAVELVRHVESGRPTDDDSGVHFLWMAVRG
jgi:spermidine synthase